MNEAVAYGQTTLTEGIRSRFVHGVNGITMYVLETGFQEDAALLHHGPRQDDGGVGCAGDAIV